MRRSWRRLAAIALLAGTALVVGVLAMLAPSLPQLLATALEGVLGRRVELHSVTLHVGRRVEVVLEGLVVWDERMEEPVFRTRRARGSQGWPSIVTGQLIPLDWSLESPTLTLRSRAEPDGAAVPSLRIPISGLEVHDGVFEWHRADGEVLRVLDLEVVARRSSLRARLSGEGRGRLLRGEGPLARVSARFSGWLEEGEFEVDFEDLDLARLAPPGVPAPSGRASGRLRLGYGGGDFALQVEAEGTGCRWVLPELKGPIQPVAECRLVGDLERRAGRLVLRPAPLQLDDFALAGEIRIDPEPGGRVRGELRVADFRPGRPDGRLQFMRLMGLHFQSWSDADRRSEAGWIRNLRARFDLPQAGLEDSLAFRRRLGPAELEITGEVTEGVYRPRPQAPPLEAISARVRIEGNVLEVGELRLAREGKPLPQMDIRLDGMHRLVHLQPEERAGPEGPGGPLSGLGPAFASIGRGRKPGRPEAVLHVAGASIGYPGFLMPLRDASASLRFPDGNLSVEQGTAIYGGAPARLEAFWDREQDHLRVAVEYEDGEVPPAPPAVGPPEQRWLDGQFDMDTLFLGDWRLDDVKGRFHGHGPSVELREVSARLAGGELASRGFVSLAESDAAPFAFAVDVTGGDVATVVDFIGMTDESVTGTLDADGIVAGRLAPERPFLADADVKVHTRLRRGTLGSTARTLLLARLTSPMGWTGIFGQPLPYSRITADFTIAEGRLRTEDFTLEGPQLGIAAAGEIALLEPGQPTDMVVALLMLESLGQVLKSVPVVGGLMPGRDQSLVTLYFQLEGPWGNPSGRPLPPGGLQTATGWAGRVLGGGFRRLLGMVSSGVTGNGSEGDDHGSPEQAR